jgi:hypothetical protein
VPKNPQSTVRMIPTFSSDGRRIRSCSAATCKRLLGLDKVTAKRNARGAIRAIHFRDCEGGSALRSVATMGQRYSFFGQVGDVHLWQLNDLDGAPEDYARVVVEACAA